MRVRDEEGAFRTFHSTPAGVKKRIPMTDIIVLAPRNVRLVKPSRSAAPVCFPSNLSDHMLRILELCGELLRAYLPGIKVLVDPVSTIELESAKMTRIRTQDSLKLRQLSSEGMHGARDIIDADFEESASPFITFVVPVDLYDDGFNFLYSTRLSEREIPSAEKFAPTAHGPSLKKGKRSAENSENEAMVVSTFQVERYVKEPAAQTNQLCQMVLYCIFGEVFDLEVCENLPCLMNNSDSVAEAMENVCLILCPTCMRKLHLMGVVCKIAGYKRRVAKVLQRGGIAPSV